ncbi:response regulator transcription factor [Streptomyces neyagawaensis]|uniref:Response regulator transcription factor n=1 Tax=Streptomyces neyagawaensis TaxID=42238 RepID=A0ABV3AU66_9ACTN
MGVRVLLIEDDETIAEPLADGLRHFGLTVHHVATGADGLRGPHGDVVLLDLGLPDMDGIDVCRGIRRSSDVPIIILSARGEEADRVLGLELGADDYLAKPFSIRELVARIRAVSRRHQRPGPEPGQGAGPAPGSSSGADPFTQPGFRTGEFTVRGEVLSGTASVPGAYGARRGTGASPEYDWATAYETPAHGTRVNEPPAGDHTVYEPPVYEPTAYAPPAYAPPSYEQAPVEPRDASGVGGSGGAGSAGDRSVPSPGPLVVDRRTRQVWVGDVPVALTPKEFELLALLTEDPGAVYSRQQILNRVWDDHYQGPTKTLDVHVATLRRKLGDPAWIQTLRGVGFRLAVRGPGQGRGPGPGPGRHHTPEAAAS